MGDVMAFSRRHTPRHSAAPPSETAARVDSSIDILTADAPRSNSKKRNGAAATATLVTATGASTPRKMSGAQLRLFFLLCVAVYFGTICFADDIVSFANWMSDDDPITKWDAVGDAKPQSKPQPRGPQADNADVDADADLTGDAATATATPSARSSENKNENSVKATGNLRGGEGEVGTKPAEEIHKPEEKEPSNPHPVEHAQTPAVAEQVTIPQKNEEPATTVATTVPPAEPTTFVKDLIETLAPVEKHEALSGLPSDEQDAPMDSVDINQLRAMGRETTHAANAVEEEGETIGPVGAIQEDAPLDSAEEREITGEKAAAASVQTTPQVSLLDAPAEIPKLMTSDPLELAQPNVRRHIDDVVETEATEVLDHNDGAQNPDSVG